MKFLLFVISIHNMYLQVFEEVPEYKYSTIALHIVVYVMI